MTRLRRILAVAGTDLRLTLRDHGNLFWLLLAPFIWVYFTGLMARPPAAAKASRGTPLTVVDEDQSEASRRLIESLRGEGFDVRVLPPGAATEGESGARRVRIPQGLEARLAAGEPTTVRLAPVEGDEVRQLRLKTRLTKAGLRFLADAAFGPTRREDDAVRLNGHWMHKRSIPMGYQHTVPGNLVMFMLMMTVASGAELLARDRLSGLLRRMAESPLTRFDLLAGKCLGRSAVGALSAGVFVFIGAVVFRISRGASPLGLVLILVSLIVCGAALSLLVGALCRTPGAASGVSTVAILVMSALGGCWWPIEITPEWLQVLSMAFPTTWAREGLHQILSWGGGVRDVLVPCAVLWGFSAGALAVAVRKLRVLS